MAGAVKFVWEVCWLVVTVTAGLIAVAFGALALWAFWLATGAEG